MAGSSELSEHLYPHRIAPPPRLEEGQGHNKTESLRVEPVVIPNKPPAEDQQDDLRKSEERFVKAFRSNPLAITITTQQEGRYVDVNDAFLEMLGYERDQVIGHTAEELDLWPIADDGLKLARELAQAGNVKRLPISFRTSTGEIREANVSAELIEIDGLSCVLAITQDVTDTKRLEDQVRQAQKLEAIGRLTGAIAHDFNNMLSVIMGYSDLSLQNLGATDPVAKNVVQIKNAAERAASFIRRLLAFSSQQVQHPRILDLNVVIQNLSQMIPRMIGEDIELTVRAAAFPIYVEADLGHLEQILMNLVVNARDTTPSGGELIIETANVDLDNAYMDAHSSVAPGKYAVLSVSDTGCGMEEPVLVRIFEPFFTTKAPGQGTGLGLSTVLGIVKQCQGNILVRSEPNVGTTFKIYFPRVEERSETALKPENEAPSIGGSETILLAEDDDALRMVLVSLLESVGYRVLAAGDPGCALELFDRHSQQISMLLTDCVMPGMSGRELACELRSRQPNLKILLMSGYAPDLILPHPAKQWGPILTKPFTRNTLLDKVRSVLR